MELPTQGTKSRRTRIRNFALAGAGVCCVGLAALGVLLPGLPTTIFLIAASYLFTKSCPYLEQRLIRNRFFAPFVLYLDEPAAMPFRAKVITIALMWIFVSISTVILARNHGVPAWVVTLPAATAVIGTWVVANLGRGRSSAVKPRPTIAPGGVLRTGQSLTAPGEVIQRPVAGPANKPERVVS